MKNFLLVLFLASFSLCSASDLGVFPDTIDKTCVLSLCSGEQVKVSGFFNGQAFVVFSVEKINGSIVTPESLGMVMVLVQESLKAQGFNHKVEVDKLVLNYLFESIEFNKARDDSFMAPLINFYWRP